MASLLVRVVDGENALRYAAGDVVFVAADDHAWGRLEDLRVWVAEGNDAASWPGGFAIVDLTGLAVDAARQYLAEGTGVRRAWKLDTAALERRAPVGARDTLRTQGWLRRAATDADVQAAFALKA